ncbi:hypothetical protein B0T17DRAFT_545627 [Bombardia bombarda]|uniref:Uncharacterized protein n=1 Tax=Bombardia bombarda TaxID=252184 RepID=A0AA39W3X7_9PEZI|nr:hypothetical protein B0T17DRAFT_545627 [Bombardia bombarda]
MTPEQKRDFSSTVTRLLGLFPAEDVKVGQMFDNWGTCATYSDDVMSVRDTVWGESKQNADITFAASEEFCELLNRHQRYLLEISALSQCKHTCQVNLHVLELLKPGPEKESLKATIKSHQAQVAEEQGNIDQAISLHLDDFATKLAEKPQNPRYISFTASNIAYSYSSKRNQTEALTWYEKAREFWGEMPNRPANILINEAICHTLLGQHIQARELFDTFQALLNSDPQPSWAVIAYGYFAMGGFHELQQKRDLDAAVSHFLKAKDHFLKAREGWEKGLQASHHPFIGACLYKAGAIRLNQGRVDDAIALLYESLVVTEHHRQERPAEHARSLHKYSQAVMHPDYHGETERAEGMKMQMDSEEELRRIDPNAKGFDSDETYDKYVPLGHR